MRHGLAIGEGLTMRDRRKIRHGLTMNNETQLDFETRHDISGNWIRVTGMINIKGAARLAKHVINCIVIAKTTRYWTAVEQRSLFIYRKICPRTGYIDSLQTANVTNIVSGKQPKDSLQRYFWGVQFAASETGRCATLDGLMYSSLVASQIDTMLDKLKRRA